MGKVDSLFLSDKLHVIENKLSSWDMLSVYETYCDLRDSRFGFVVRGESPCRRLISTAYARFMIGKRMF